MIVFSLLVFFVFNACNSGSSQNANIEAAEYNKLLAEKKEYALIDVRTPEEYVSGYLKNAVNADWNSSAFKSYVNRLDKSKPVFLYCLSGGRSSAAKRYLESNGFKEVYNLSGGILAWRAAGFQEVNESQPVSDKISIDEFDSKISTSKIILVDFYADWCVPCKKMKPDLDKLSEEWKGKAEIWRINADENKQLSKKLNVQGLPLILVYKNGVQTWRNLGYADKATMEAQLK